ncbi:MAG: NADH-quinone oxidoreductase subunit L [Actinobacteria bacterium]|nr:NADH-quinone oxidoreductase subunit L [Actinomycetota bacterium]
MNARDVLDLAWVVPALPLLGAAVLLLFGGRYLREPASGWIATLLMGGAFAWSVVTLIALWSLDSEERLHVTRMFDWIPSGSLQVSASFLVDPLAVTMILFVTGVGALIHLYAIGYMHGDERFSRFFLYLNLFAASMLILVLGGSFPVTFLGWEGVGVCSYLLISFWFERDSAAAAGKKAFVTNRVGDFGFLLAMFLVFFHLGTLEIAPALAGASVLSEGTATAIALLFFLGAVGKSAQLPLHVWLPDAMEGPTPVSALIHAATMVTAGVYLVVRTHPFFLAGDAGTVVAWVGVITAFTAATIALVHNDIKRVLAYSTISQLGYMFLAAGVGAYAAAIFHMVTHAFFKALLFLGAGSVIHGLHGEQDMRLMGGLRKYMPATAGTFIVAWLAIAGMVPLAGFWSKDEILAKAWFDGQVALWVLGAVTALLTAFYMTRQVWLVFFGEARWTHASDEATPHESPRVMTFPLVVLAGLTVFGGLLNLPFKSLEFLTKWLDPVFERTPGFEHIEADSFGVAFGLSVAAVLLGVAGIALAYRLYSRASGRDPARERLGAAAEFLEQGWRFDWLYETGIVKPGRKALDAVSRGFDLGIVDGAVNGIARALQLGGTEARRAQSGYVRRYAFAVFAGATLLIILAMTRATGA